MNKDLRYFTIPNIFTLLNLIAGSFAIFYAFEKSETLHYASYFILAALVFDFLDGLVARLINAESKIGAQLDSLADLVSFGIAPAAITYQLLAIALKANSPDIILSIVDLLILMSPILLILAAALRLAKFNVDDRQKRDFFGMPTPVSALFFISIPLLNEFNPDNLVILKVWLDVNLSFDFILGVIGLQVFVIPSFLTFVVAIIIASVLQLVDLSMFSLKFDGLSFSKNKTRYTFVIISFFLFIFLQCFIAPFIVILYVLFSIGDDIIKYLNIKESGYDSQKTPKTWIGLSIIATLIFSTPFGIVAIVYSIMTTNRIKKGNLKSAYKTSNNAIKWVSVSLIVTLFSIVPTILFFIIDGIK